MRSKRKMEGSITIENAVIIPLFTMILLLLVSFTLYLHYYIDSRVMELRKEESSRFSEERYQPQAAIRAYQALQNEKRGDFIF